MVLCKELHPDKSPFLTEEDAKAHVAKTYMRRESNVRAFKQRGDKALRTLHHYQCPGCALWYVATDKPGIVDHTQELQRTIDRHNKSGVERRRVLAAVKFNTPRLVSR